MARQEATSDHATAQKSTPARARRSRKGSPNAKKLAFRERLARYESRKKVNSFFFMVDMLADTTTVPTALPDGSIVELPTVSMALKFQAAKELSQYKEPKLRSVVIAGDQDNPLRHLHELPQEQLDGRIARLLRTCGYAGDHAALPEGGA